MKVPGRRSVTVLRRVRQYDADGKPLRGYGGAPVYADEEVVVEGCSVQPTSSTEDNDDQRVLVTSLVTIYAPLSFPAGPVDAVLIDGVRHEIQGKPQRWEHPRLGHVVVIVREATG